MASTIGEGSSTPPKSTAEKPVIVRVKRKTSHSRLDGFWLEINERPTKRPLLDFEKLSISDSAEKEEWKPKKVFVQHVETVTSDKATIDIVQSFVPNSADASEGKPKSEERRHTFKKDSRQGRQDQLLSKARQNQKILAKNARFEQIWRSRKGTKEAMHDKALHEIYHFYDVVRVDVEERSNKVQIQEELSLEDQRLLSSYLPLMREFIPSAAAEIESDMRAYMSKQDDYVYDYYTVKDDMNVDHEDVSNPFPLVQVEDEDFYDGPDESEYDSEDSNAEDNPRNDYPDEISEGEEEVESETLDESEEDENESVSGEYSEHDSLEDGDLLHDNEIYYDGYNDDGDDFDFDGNDNGDGDGDGEGEDSRWSYR